MKRFLIAAVVGVFVIGLAAPLFAAEITVRGYNRVRYRNTENREMDQNRDTATNKRNYFDSRVRISVDAKLVEGLSGRIETEYGADFGVNGPFDSAEGRVAVDTDGNAGVADGVVGIRQAWVQAKVPGTPVTLRLGRDTSLVIAHGFTVGGTTYGIDQIRANVPLGPADVWLFYAVADKGPVTNGATVGDDTRFSYNEVNVYGVTVPITAAPGIVFNPYALVHHAGGGTTPATDLTTGEKNQYIVGAAVDVKQGPVSAWIETAYNGGRAREAGFVGGTFNTKIVRRAYFVAGGAEVTQGNLKFGLETGLSSGDKNGTSDGTAKNSDAPAHDHALGWIQDVAGAPGPGNLGNSTTRTRLRVNGIATDDGSSVCPVGMCGTAVTYSPGQAFVKADVQIKPNPEWTFNFAASYHQATIVAHGAKRGIGTELYANAVYQMYRNFVVTARAGYLFAGPFFTRYDLADGDPDNPFLWRVYGEFTF